ncbi:hypothetical protein [Actinoplanes sp. HUAS TT8]|uniref:hypothetical protein n=1 Tax=Actinoplanes sp. HUAS TT8 TaxID=3447453 RepID=UPI003F525A35
MTRRIDQPYGRRSRTAAGMIGLAAVLGAGAYVTTSLLVDDDTDTAQEYRVVTPATTPPSSSPAVSSPAAAAATSAGTPSASTTTDQARVRQEIMAARKAAEKDGFPVERPIEEQVGHAVGASSETTRSLPGGGTMKITTAAYDLSGRRPLNWAADQGTDVDGSKCTQKFHFSQGDPGGLRPTMLLCWRTSDKRSVAVLSVTPNGKPSIADSTATVDSEWKKLG